MEAVVEILKELDWSPLWISLKTGTAATVISFFLESLWQERSCIRHRGKSGSGWDPDASDGHSAYGGRLLSAAFVQQEKTAWNPFIRAV